MARVVAYLRVSTAEQTTDNQLHRILERYPHAEVHTEVMSGTKRRPVLEALLASLERGDTLISLSIDRLGRRVVEILQLLEGLEKRGVIVQTLRENLDMSTPIGRMVLTVMASVASLERELMAERTRTALAARKAAGVRLGRPKSFSPEKRATIVKLRAEGMKLKEIGVTVGLSVSRVSEVLKEAA